MTKLIFKIFICDMGLNALFDSLLKQVNLMNLTESDMYHIANEITYRLITIYGFTNELVHEIFTEGTVYGINPDCIDNYVDSFSDERRQNFDYYVNEINPYLKIIWENKLYE